MISKSQMAKINRKQKRCQNIITKETAIESVQDPTKFLGICNAGLSTGLQEEKLLEAALSYGKVEEVVMIPGKSYCFLYCHDIDEGQLIFDGLHGKCGLGQNGSVLYLSYFQSIPQVINPWTSDLPAGLILLENFVSEQEEATMLHSIENDSDSSTPPTSALKHRRVQHYGYEFLYGSNLVDPNSPLDRKIPECFQILWPRLREKLPNLEWSEPDQLTVNHYTPGQGIPPHVDTHSAFLDPIFSLSLQGDTVMEFRRKDQIKFVYLPKRSLLIMSGESRYDWRHGITPRQMDVIPSPLKGLTVKSRDTRTSFTFRTLKSGPCDCQYPALCNSRTDCKTNAADLKDIAEKLELTNVHKVYDEIANHFSETRHSPWPKVADFVNSFENGSILLDIGCGNGKYLGINQNIAEIGCDRSRGLLKICNKSNFNTFQCDCLSLPFRDNSVDGCISIAVIHHLATKERRLTAIAEMIRILRANGRALIYVWAKNQEADSKKSSYLRQNKALNKNKVTEEELRDSANQLENIQTEIALPIHTNRTHFKEQDVYVPWKLKTKDQEENCTFLRYYHVFEENELSDLCTQLGGIECISSYYDQGNWCVVFRKL